MTPHCYNRADFRPGYWAPNGHNRLRWVPFRMTRGWTLKASRLEGEVTHERIYLQIADDDVAVLGHSPDRVGPTDIEYVRADLHVAVQAELARLEADNARLRSLLRALLHDVKFAISSGDWRVDGRCDPTITIERAEEALAGEGGDA